MNQKYSMIFCLIFLFVGTSATFAQKKVPRPTTIISGVIQDAETKEKLPFVNIYFTGTTIGVTSDLYGSFKLETNDESLRSMSVAYLGYADKEIDIIPGSEQVINVSLVSNAAQLNEVVVKGKRKVKKDTAALRLYHNVVRHKATNQPSNLDSYTYEEYAKTEFDLYNLSEKFKKRKVLKPFDFVFDNTDTTASGVEFLPVLLKEAISDVYYTKEPEKYKQVIKADQFSGIDNASISSFVDYTFDEVDIYDNMLQVSGRGFVSPFSTNALTTYKYFLADSASIDGRWCYKLEFTGKRKQDLAFSGHAWIADSVFAIKSIELYILQNVNLNFINDFGLRQSFEQLGGKSWFKNEEYTFTSLNLSKDADKQSVMIRRTTTREKIKYDIPIEDEIFSGDKVEMLASADKKKADYWATARHYDLSDKEKSIFNTIDSVKSTTAYKMISWFSYLGTSAFAKAGPIEFGRIYKFYSFNAIEGSRIRFGGRTNGDFSKKIQLDAYGAYGTKDKDWKYNVGFRSHLKRYNNRWHMLTGHYRYDLVQLDQRDPLLTHDNLILALLRTSPLSRLLKVRRGHIEYQREWMKGLSTNISTTHQIFYSVPNGIEFMREIEQNGEVRDTVSVPEFSTMEAKASIVWGTEQKFLETAFGRYPLTYAKPVFTLDYTIGINGVLGSDYNYHKLELNVRHNLNHPLGTTKYQVFGGKIFGKTPYPGLKIHKGNETFLFNKWANNVMSEFEYVHDEYAALWVEHHFNGLIMNRIPLIKKLKLRSLIYGKAMIGRLSKDNREIVILHDTWQDLNEDGIEQLTEFEVAGGLNAPYRLASNPEILVEGEPYYLEVGFGIENIFKMIRVDFMWRVTQRDKLDIQKWGVKIALQPQI